MSVLFLGAGLSGWGQTTPFSISYQGVLRDGTGAIVDQTSLPIYFTIYSDPTSTNATSLLWQELQTCLIDTNGLFNVALGIGGSSVVKGAGITTFADVFSGAGQSGEIDRWLELQVNDGSSKAILPRQQFLSAPFALAANTAFNAVAAPGDFTVSGSLTVSDGASVAGGDLTVSNDLVVTGVTRANGGLSVGGGATPVTNGTLVASNITAVTGTFTNLTVSGTFNAAISPPFVIQNFTFQVQDNEPVIITDTTFGTNKYSAFLAGFGNNGAITLSGVNTTEQNQVIPLQVALRPSTTSPNWVIVFYGTWFDNPPPIQGVDVLFVRRDWVRDFRLGDDVSP